MTNSSDSIAELSPSAKLVYKILEYNGERLTQQQLADRSYLPQRTVRDAVSQLREAQVINETTDLADPRRKVYFLETASGDGSEPTTEARTGESPDTI